MKKLIIPVAVLIAFLMGLALLIPRNVSVAKTININASRDSIMRQVSDFSQWAHWFPLLKENLAVLDVQSSGHALLKRENGKNIDIHFLKMDVDSVVFSASIANGSRQRYVIRTTALSGGGVRTDMIVSTSFAWYPWQRARSLFMDKLTGPQYEEALKNLQLFCESH